MRTDELRVTSVSLPEAGERICLPLQLFAPGALMIFGRVARVEKGRAERDH